MTWDQFEALVENAIEKHISRDKTICAGDQQWEAHNAARTISQRLRYEIPFIPRPERRSAEQ